MEKKAAQTPEKIKAQSSWFWDKIDGLNEFGDWAMLRMGPGPRFIKFNQNINLNKGSLPVIIMALMIYY